MAHARRSFTARRAIRQDGTLQAWGSNAMNERGDRTLGLYATPGQMLFS